MIVTAEPVFAAMVASRPAAEKPTSAALAARLTNVSLRYKKTVALDAVNLDLPAGCMVGLIGPDGVGKSSLLSLIAGARRIQEGRVEVLGGDMADAGFRRATCPRIAYMPQGLGKNLYPTLSVFENTDFFARLFGQRRPSASAASPSCWTVSGWDASPTGRPASCPAA